MNAGAEAHAYGASVDETSSAYDRARAQFERRVQNLLDKSVPHRVERWSGYALVAFLYLVRAYFLRGYYIVTYGLGIYNLNLLIGFLSPQRDPESLRAGGDDAGDADGKPRVPDGVAHAVHVRIRGGKVCARLLLGEDCIPLQLRMQMWGSEEVYELSDWRSPSDGGAMFPARVAHYPASGGTDTYVATRAGAAAVSDALFVAPDVHARAADTTYIENMSPLVQARRTPGGHILVRALLNGCDCGEWLLDTGCSGLVVSKATADKLRMETFGKLSITSVGGSHQSQMRRCATLQIGPVVMANPLFREIHDAIDVVDSAQGSNAPAGIIGWDFFRRAAVGLLGGCWLRRRASREPLQLSGHNRGAGA